MAAEKVRRPAISAAFYDPSPLATAGLLLYALALYWVPALGARALYDVVENPLLKILCMTPLIILAGYGIQLMVSVGHDGTHLSLSKNRFISSMIGIFYASVAMTYFEMGFALQHWEHHRFTNQASDPDISTLQKLKGPWQRLFLTRFTFNWGYAKSVLGIIAGKPYKAKYHLPFKPEAIRLLCTFNLVCALFWLGIFVWMTLNDPLSGVVCVAAPLFVAILISGAEGYMNHAGTGIGVFHDTRSRTSKFWTAVLMGANYHLEHHLYPGVPCYRLPRLHRFLEEQGILQKAQASADEEAFFGAYVNHLGSEYEVKGADDAFDPLLHAVANNGSSRDDVPAPNASAA